MLASFLTKVFGSKNERELKKLQPIIEQINALETDLKALSDDQLKGHTAKFKERLHNGERWTICFLRPLRLFGRLRCGFGCATLTFS